MIMKVKLQLSKLLIANYISQWRFEEKSFIEKRFYIFCTPKNPTLCQSGQLIKEIFSSTPQLILKWIPTVKLNGYPNLRVPL